MGRVQICRMILLILCLLISLPATGFTAHYLYTTVIPPAGPFIYSFEILGLVIGAFALLFIPALLIGNITVALDLVAIFIFWVLWLAESILVAKFRTDYYNAAKAQYDYWATYYGYINRFPFELNCTSISGGYCYELYVIQSLMITQFVLSFVYFIGMLSYAFVRQSHGASIWRSYIRRLDQVETPPFIMQAQVPWQGTAPVNYGTPVMAPAGGWEANSNRAPTSLTKENTTA